ncbi:hypothetical protein MPC4_350014 [Methylocella tundrae]|uniref:Uncharacterized protein n=1 Tax=Methylocella tundrae TaxID=227605 RepID=A0A8B6MB67_METTU|nr:hypothetical protein MPC4_350014 [Methylocella tundrae]
MKLVEAGGELFELALAEFGWSIARAVGRANDGKLLSLWSLRMNAST